MQKFTQLSIAVMMTVILAACGGGSSSPSSGGVVNNDVYKNRAEILVNEKPNENLPQGVYDDLSMGSFDLTAEMVTPEIGLVRVSFLAKHGADISLSNYKLSAVLVDESGQEPDMPVDLQYAIPTIEPLPDSAFGFFQKEKVTFDFVVDNEATFPRISDGKFLRFFPTADASVEVIGDITGMRLFLLSDTEQLGEGTPSFYSEIADQNLIWEDGFREEGVDVLDSERFGNGYEVKADTEEGRLPEKTVMATYHFNDDGTDPFDPFDNKPMFLSNSELGEYMIVDGQVLSPGLEKDVPLQRYFISSAAVDGQVLIGHNTYYIKVSNRPNKDETFQFIKGYILVEYADGSELILDVGYLTVIELEDQGDGYDRFEVLFDVAMLGEILAVNDQGAFVTLVATVKAPGIASIKDAYLAVKILGDSEFPDARPTDYDGVVTSNFAWGDGSDLNPATAFDVFQWGNARDVIDPFTETGWVTYWYRPAKQDVVIVYEAPPVVDSPTE